MQIYEVRISHGARADMAELRKFLKSMMTVEGAIRYANNMREEIKTLAFYADLYGKTTSMTLRQIHPEARRMVSHNILRHSRPNNPCQDEQRLNLFDPNMINTTKHIWPITVTTDRYRGGFCEV